MHVSKIHLYIYDENLTKLIIIGFFLFCVTFRLGVARIHSIALTSTVIFVNLYFIIMIKLSRVLKCHVLHDMPTNFQSPQ